MTVSSESYEQTFIDNFSEPRPSFRIADILKQDHGKIARITENIWFQYIQDNLSAAKKSGIIPIIQFPKDRFKFFVMARTIAWDYGMISDGRENYTVWNSLTGDERFAHNSSMKRVQKMLEKLEKEGKIKRSATKGEVEKWRKMKKERKEKEDEKEKMKMELVKL